MKPYSVWDKTGSLNKEENKDAKWSPDDKICPAY